MNSDENKPGSMWREIETGYLRKIGEDAAARTNAREGSLGALLGFLGLWIVGSTWFGFAAGQPAPFLVFNGLIVVAVLSTFRA